MGCVKSTFLGSAPKQKQKPPEEKDSFVAGSRSASRSAASSYVGSTAFFSEAGEVLESAYEMEPKILGSGSYASVHRGRHLQTGKVVAIKCINKKASRRELLDTEITVMRRFCNGNPHIVHLYASFETEDFVQLVLEFMGGGELFEALDANGPYGESEAALHIRAVASALEFLHGNRVAHRDLKPENLLLTGRPPAPSVLKISDFGLAKILSPQELMRTACGTWAYCAPEVLVLKNTQTGGYDCKCDMFSVGVLLFVVLAAYHPFDIDGNNTDVQMQDLIMRGEWNFDDPAWEDVSDQGQELIELLLEPSPTKRLSASELLAHPWTQGLSPYGSLAKSINTDLSEYSWRMKQKEMKAGLKAVDALVRMNHLAGATKKEEKERKTRRDEAQKRWERVRTAFASGELTSLYPNRFHTALKAAVHKFKRDQQTLFLHDAQRHDNIIHCFKKLDADKNGRLNKQELGRFVKFVGFQGGDAEWSKEYKTLCEECGWSKEMGVDMVVFEVLVNTKDCTFFATNGTITKLLAELKKDKDAKPGDSRPPEAGSPRPPQSPRANQSHQSQAKVPPSPKAARGVSERDANKKQKQQKDGSPRPEKAKTTEPPCRSPKNNGNKPPSFRPDAEVGRDSTDWKMASTAPTRNPSDLDNSIKAATSGRAAKGKKKQDAVIGSPRAGTNSKPPQMDTEDSLPTVSTPVAGATKRKVNNNGPRKPSKRRQQPATPISVPETSASDSLGIEAVTSSVDRNTTPANAAGSSSPKPGNTPKKKDIGQKAKSKTKKLEA